VRIRQVWKVCIALLNVFVVAQLVGIFGIFSNTELTEKLIGILSEEIGKFRLAMQQLRSPIN